MKNRYNSPYWPMSKIKSKRTSQAPTQGETLKNMKTPLEQQLEDVEMIESNQKRSKNITETNAQLQQEEVEEVGRVTVNDLKQADQERLSILVNHLIAKNKINAKNAFEVPLIQLGETNDFNTMNGDNSWKRVSSNLENNNKIYGYRVDAAHNFTYKVLELVTRSERKDAVDDVEISKSYRYNNVTLNTQFFSDCLEDYYVKHLERNQKNINILHVDTFFNANPILEKTKRTFDQQGLKALLLNHVGIGEDLALLIYFESEKSVKMKIQNLDSEEEKEQQQLETGDYLKDYNIFLKIYGICCLHDLLDEDGVEVKREESQFQSIWREFEHMSQSKTNKIVEINLENNQQPRPQQPIPYEELKANEPEPVQKINEQVSPHGDLRAEQNKQHLTQDLLHGNLENNEKQLVETQRNQEASSEKQKQTQKLSEKDPGPKEPSQQPELQVEACKSQLRQAQQGQQNTPFFQAVLNNPDQEERDNHIDQTSQEPSKTILESVRLSQSKYTPISSIITFRYFKKDNIASDPILRELQVDGQFQKEKESALQKWKGIDNPTKKQRKPRVKKQIDPQFDHINFKQPLDMRKAQNKRSSILGVDKVKKLEIKKFLKNVAESYKEDTYTYFNTSEWRYSFDITTFIRECITFQNQASEQLQNLRSPQIIDLQVLNSTTTSALMRAASIRSVKQKIRIFMFDDHLSSFIKIYNQYVSDEGTISPALCFLTVLHLCNEQDLKLVQKDENDFEITEQE